MTLLQFLLIGALLALSVAGNAIDCLEGIVAATGQFIFNATDAYYNNLCHGELFLTSVYAAAKTYCTPEEIVAGSASVGRQCIEYGFTVLTPYEEFAPGLTDAFISSLPVVGFEDIAASPMRNTSVIVSKSLFKTGADTFSVFKMSLVIDARYGWGVYGFWGGVLLIGIVSRLFGFLVHKTRRDHPHDAAALESRSSPTSYTTSQRIWGWAQAKVILPPLIGTYHRRLLRTFTIPTRIQSFVVLAYWAWSIIICAVSYRIFTPNLYYTPEVQAWRYIADRTGIMSYANLPVMWMFSGRNNVFLWATGWEFSTFNLFHRHVARIATLQAFIHSVGWTVIQLKSGKAVYAATWKDQYWYMGGLAMVTMAFIVGSSTIMLRRKFYEVFLVLHIILSITTIVGLFFHTKILVGQYEPYLWPLVAIWCFDRFVRIIRQVNCNLRVKSGKLSTTTSTVEYIEEANLLILSVTLGTSSLKPKPNQHYFLYQPFKWRGWENHPFTAASWTHVPQENLSSDSSQSSIPSSPHPSAKEDNEITVAPLSASQNSKPITTGRVKLTFYVRPSTPSSSSFTNQLRKMCLADNSRSPVPSRLLLEGPYGSHESLSHYDNILFITGGTGISAALPYLKSFSQPTTTNQLPPNVKFIWTTKQARMVHEIFTRELATLPTSPNVQISTFITGKDQSASSSLNRSSDDDEKEKPISKDISLGISHGRPDLKSLIDNMAEEKGRKSMAVFVCGPASMADQARDAVTACLNRGVRRVELIEEVFGW